MQPGQKQTSLDYLNQISAPPPKRGLKFNLKTVIIGAVLLIITTIIVSIVVNVVVSGPKSTWQRLSAKLSTTSNIAEDASKIIKSSQLRSLNSDLKIYITNTNRDLEAELLKAGVSNKTIPKSIQQKNDGSDIKSRLEDARLNGKYDSSYAREMSYQLSTIMSIFQSLYNSTGSESTKTFLDSAYKNLKPTQQALEDFSSVNE